MHRIAIVVCALIAAGTIIADRATTTSGTTADTTEAAESVVTNTGATGQGDTESAGLAVSDTPSPDGGEQSVDAVASTGRVYQVVEHRELDAYEFAPLKVEGSCLESCVSDSVFDWLSVGELDPEVRIEAALRTIDSLSGSHALGMCHGLGHGLGQSAAATFGVATAGSAVRPNCEDGYAHGVAEHAGTLADFNPESIGELICARLDPLGCAHAVGHGIGVATNGDVRQAVERCASYAQNVSGDIGVQDGCNNGAMMFAFEAARAGKGVMADMTIQERCAALPESMQRTCRSEMGAEAVIADGTPEEIFAVCRENIDPADAALVAQCVAQGADHLIWRGNNLNLFLGYCRDFAAPWELACYAGAARAVSLRPGWVTVEDVCAGWRDPAECTQVVYDWIGGSFLNVSPSNA